MRIEAVGVDFADKLALVQDADAACKPRDLGEDVTGEQDCGAMATGEIAQKLHLSQNTVKTHLSSSFAKLGVRSRSEAAALILDPEAGLGTGILTITDRT